MLNLKRIVAHTRGPVELTEGAARVCITTPLYFVPSSAMTCDFKCTSNTFRPPELVEFGSSEWLDSSIPLARSSDRQGSCAFSTKRRGPPALSDPVIGTAFVSHGRLRRNQNRSRDSPSCARSERDCVRGDVALELRLRWADMVEGLGPFQAIAAA